jgi:hypothetical protein
MFAGQRCSANITVTSDMRQLALQRLRQAAFLGDTDDWDNSICLFHAMFGGRSSNHSFVNVRPTLAAGHQIGGGGDTTTAHNRSAPALQAFSPTDDPDDWLLYQEARRLIDERMLRYGRPTYRLLEIPATKIEKGGGGGGEGGGR